MLWAALCRPFRTMYGTVLIKVSQVSSSSGLGSGPLSKNAVSSSRVPAFFQNSWARK